MRFRSWKCQPHILSKCTISIFVRTQQVRIDVFVDNMMGMGCRRMTNQRCNTIKVRDPCRFIIFCDHSLVINEKKFHPSA